MAEMVSMGYVNDLSNDEWMTRPHADCNHINFQIGHLISSEHRMVSAVMADKMPALPEGFDEMYSKENSTSDDAAKFMSKEQLMEVYQQQRAGTLAALESCAESDWDKESGVPYAPTVGAIFNMQSAHWLMHCGQWVIVRRMLSKPVVI